MTIKCPGCQKILDNSGIGLKYEWCTKCVMSGKPEFARQPPNKMTPVFEPPKVDAYYQWTEGGPEQKLLLLLKVNKEELGLTYQQMKMFYYEMKQLMEIGPPKDGQK